ncbi:MAG: ATP-dependent Clp protease ATP-binding subunit [Candidatus Dojkabacteria bacterium]
MKILRGTQKIGTVNGVDVRIDLSHLFKDRGGLKNKITIEKSFGNALVVLAILIILSSLFITIFFTGFDLQGYLFPSSFEYLLAYMAMPVGLYGLFLKRNREEFLDSDRITNLPKELDRATKGKRNGLIINEFLTVELLTVLDNLYFESEKDFLKIFISYVLNHSNLRELIEKRLGVNSSNIIQKSMSYLQTIDCTFTSNYIGLLVASTQEAIFLGGDKIDVVTMFFVLCRGVLKSALLSFGVNELDINSLEVWQKNELRKENYYKRWKIISKLKPTGPINRSYTSRATPTLDIYSEDLTARSAKGEFTTSIGREIEISNFLRILQKGSGAACLLLGEPGVGKTTLVKYLATKMSVEDVPASLQDSRLITIDLNKVLTKAGSIDSFKAIIQKCLEEVKNSGNIILVLEEIGQVMSIREEGRMEVVNLLVNAIDALKLRLIATSNLTIYNKYIKPIKSLASLFEVVEIKEPSSYLSQQILVDELDKLENKYGIKVQVSAIKKIVEFAPRFEAERSMPDKGIDLLEEAILLAKSQGLNYLNNQIAEQLISSKVGINIGTVDQGESERLMKLEDTMHEGVVGQDDAIKSIAMAIRRARSGLSGFKQKPVASFLFYGPTGVGKTESAKTLADVYYGSSNLMIRIDMSEYQEESNLNRLIGYTDNGGNFVGGYLTDAVKLKPYSLILLDEIEKANKKVLDLFLQVLDEGSITDGMSRKVDFTNTIIIMTSNAASEQIAELIERGEKYNEVLKETAPILRKEFRIEFLNRFDKLIMFKSLNQEEIKEVVEINLKALDRNLETKGMSVFWDEKTLEELSALAYNPIYGARELKRVVQDNIEDILANLIIQGRLKSGNDVYFSGLEVKEIK